jgi:two-component system, NarL family, nitrate/nitrite response regulator NarL
MAFRKPSIALAEDHEPMRTRISNLLERDYNVVAAVENGVLAVEAVIAYQPDLALLDIAMPQMNGIQVGRKIRELELSTKIIFLSAQVSPGYLELARGLGAGYVLKNQLHSHLLMAIEEALAGKTFSSMIPMAKLIS